MVLGVLRPVDRGQSPRSVQPCLALLQGNAAVAEGRGGTCGMLLSSSFQLIPLSHLLPLAREGDRWGWHGLEACQEVSEGRWVSSLLCFFLLQPSNLSRRMSIHQSVFWQLRPSYA